MRIRFRRTLGATIAALTTTLALVSPARAEFPDQGNRILFVRGKLNAPMARTARGSEFEVADLFSMKNNGKDVRRVTETPSTTEFGGWYSPDGEEIVFWGLKGERLRVFRADADGRHVTALTSNQTSVMPNWSKNGKQIVYVKYPPLKTRSLWQGGAARGVANSDLMIMDADGSGKHSILAGDSIASPGWSPTRAEIAFSMETPDGGKIFLIPPDGGEPQLVCCETGDALFLDWSPDGRRLLFLAGDPDPIRRGAPVTQVMSIRRNGSDLVEITDRSFFPTLPRFADDAERVVYTREDGETFDLIRTRSDGAGGTKRLTDTPNKVEFLNLLGL
jgi:Tol biopolymer transport system component